MNPSLVNRRTACLGLFGGLAVLGAPRLAGAAPAYDAANKIFRLDGNGVSYVFAVNPDGQLQTLHWGGALATGDTFAAVAAPRDYSAVDQAPNVTPLEYAGFGGGLALQPSLKVSYPDGVRDIALAYVSHRLKADGIVIRLKDIHREVYVELTYAMDEATGILARSAVVENRTSSWVQVDQMMAATMNLPAAEDYQMHYLTGRWAAEWTLQSRAVEAGEVDLQSRHGDTGHQNNPWLAITRGAPEEEFGPVWFGALAWSGTWLISVNRDDLGGVRINAGFNPFDFAYRLKPGETLSSPVFYAGYSETGMGGASRTLHRFQRTKILPQKPRPRPRPVLYNSWEATEFKVDVAGQVALAEKAASIGVERFVMDDGWFGARNTDKAGLGDWVVNPVKFPNGLKPLIDKVHGLGMDFGLWVEPEMVNPDSDLYRAHPDWVINFPTRPRTPARNQLVLNLARPDVKAYILKALFKLLDENDIAFLKWDHNRNWSEPGWPAAPEGYQQRIYVDFVTNLYDIMAQLRHRYPRLEIESCSGGGGRVDMGVMAYTDQMWPSDNTDPFDRLTIQDGFSHAYAPGTMMCWVTDSPNWVNQRSTSLEYRFLSSMQGGLGLGTNLNHWQAEDFATAKRMIAAYKTIRTTVQGGDLYRLISPRDGSERSATLSVSPDRSQAALFVFLHSSSEFDRLPLVTLRGLDPDKVYAVRAMAGKAEDGTPATASGRYWMEHGLSVPLRGDFQAAGFVFEVPA